MGTRPQEGNHVGKTHHSGDAATQEGRGGESACTRPGGCITRTRYGKAGELLDSGQKKPPVRFQPTACFYKREAAAPQK